MAIIAKQIDDPNDDGYTSNDWKSFSNNELILRIGNSSVGGLCRGFARFSIFDKLKGTKILIAYIELYITVSEGSAKLRIYADRQEAPSQISNPADHRNRPRTIAGVDWSIPSGMGWKQSPSIIQIIQELANIYNPSAIQFLMDETGADEGNSCDFRAYEYGNHNYGPKMHIEYSLAKAAKGKIASNIRASTKCWRSLRLKLH